jgi:molecular chaperone HscA
MDHAREDMDARNLREQQVEAERVWEALEAALAVDGQALLSDEERAAIEATVAELKQAHAGNDYRALKSTIEKVNRASSEFAARRMNRSIQEALSGHKVEEFN